MPDRRRHRGSHPSDDALFAERWHVPLRTAVAEMSWLLSRDYSETASLKLVGDRHVLTARQRRAVLRCACSDAARTLRRERRVAPDAMGGRSVALDGFNALITVEAALSGGLVLVGRDGAHRDIASIHGSYRKVSETPDAVRLIGRALDDGGAGAVTWHLDRPVSNSGRLRALLLDLAQQDGWTWTVVLEDGVDRALAASADVVATADAWILDRCAASMDLAGAVVARDVPQAWVLDLGARA